MNARTALAAALAAAVAAFAAAGGLRLFDRTSRTADGPVGPFLPELAARANDVVRIELDGAEGRFAAVLGAGGWTAPEHAEYPVEAEKVRQLVLDLSQLETVEERTRSAAFHPSLGLVDPAQTAAADDESAARRVRLLDRHGEPVVDLFVGRATEGTARGRAGRFVRLAGEDVAWELRGRLDVRTGVGDWLDRSLPKFERGRMQRIEIVHPDGEELIVEAAGEGQFTLLTRPEGRELAWPGAAGSVAASLEHWTFEDVAPREQIDFSTPDAVVARFLDRDGLELTLTSVEVDGAVWLALDAQAIELPEPAGPALPAEEGAEQAAVAAEPTRRPFEAVAAEAEGLTRGPARFAFRLPEWGTERVRQRHESLLRPLQSDAASGFPPTTPGAPPFDISGLDFESLDLESLLENLPPTNDD